MFWKNIFNLQWNLLILNPLTANFITSISNPSEATRLRECSPCWPKNRCFSRLKDLVKSLLLGVCFQYISYSHLSHLCRSSPNIRGARVASCSACKEVMMKMVMMKMMMVVMMIFRFHEAKRSARTQNPDHWSTASLTFQLRQIPQKHIRGYPCRQSTWALRKHQKAWKSLVSS